MTKISVGFVRHPPQLITVGILQIQPITALVFVEYTFTPLFVAGKTQVLMEIRRLILESEAAHPAPRAGGSITFSGNSLVKGENETPRLLRRPSNLKKLPG